MNKAALLKAFERAINNNYPYVFVVIEAEGIKECIVVPKESFDDKKKFYMNAYNDELTHVMNSDVKITSVGYGDEKHLPNFV